MPHSGHQTIKYDCVQNDPNCWNTAPWDFSDKREIFCFWKHPINKSSCTEKLNWAFCYKKSIASLLFLSFVRPVQCNLEALKNLVFFPFETDSNTFPSGEVSEQTDQLQSRLAFLKTAKPKPLTMNKPNCGEGRRTCFWQNASLFLSYRSLRSFMSQAKWSQPTDEILIENMIANVRKVNLM